MEDLLSFYKKLLNNLGLEVTEDDYIKYMDSTLMQDGKPIVMPTKKQLNELIDKDENGKYVVSKIPFNPFNEDMLKGDSISLTKIRHIIEYKISKDIYFIGYLLLTLASNKKLQSRTNVDVNKFLAEINTANNNNIKQLIDDATMKAWETIHDTMHSQMKRAVSIYIKKRGSYNGVTYARIASLNSIVYDQLVQADKDTPIFGVKLRNKDLKIFTIIYKFILNELDDKDTMQIGSNDGESPASVALLSLFATLIRRINKLYSNLSLTITEIGGDDKPINVKELIVADPITLEEAETISRFKAEFDKIPNENTLDRQATASDKQEQKQNQVVQRQPNVYPTTPQPISNELPEGTNPALKIHMKNTGMVFLPNRNEVQQPVMYGQPAMIPQVPPVMAPNMMQPPAIVPPPIVHPQMFQQPAMTPPVMAQQPVFQQPQFGNNVLQHPSAYYRPQGPVSLNKPSMLDVPAMVRYN